MVDQLSEVTTWLKMLLVRWLFRSRNSCYEEDRATIAANNGVEKVSQTVIRKKGVDTIVMMRKLVLKLQNICVSVEIKHQQPSLQRSLDLLLLDF